MERPSFNLNRENEIPIEESQAGLEKWGFLYKNLSNGTKERLKRLTPDQCEALSRTLTTRNGRVVENNRIFAAAVEAAVGCNNNVSALGSEAQSKETLCYLLKYITKPPVELNQSLSLLQQARENIQKFRSKADDSGTEERTAISLGLLKFTNKKMGKIGKKSIYG